MIRAAAKNFPFSAVVVEPESYDAVLEELRCVGQPPVADDAREPGRRGLRLHRPLRHRDRALVRRAREAFPPLFVRAFEKVLDLPYGENPHQRAAYYSQVGCAYRTCCR